MSNPVLFDGVVNYLAGHVVNVVQQLRAWEANHFVPPDTKLANHDPRCNVQWTTTYLEHNRLSQWILNRPGSFFHRSSTNTKQHLASAA